MKTPCDQVRANIGWYLYNELDEQEQASVEEHVESCLACAAELERERRFLAGLSTRPVLEPSAALTAECRHDLMRSIYRAERLRAASAVQAGPLEALRAAWLALGAWRQPVAAMCLLAMGFFGGSVVRSPGGGGPLNPNDLAIANISGVNLGPQAGQVQISFDELRRRTLSGKMQDPGIRDFLIYAARSYANPGVQMDTIEILREKAGERQIRDMLLYVLGNDRNPGVRLKALESLKPFSGDSGVRQALIQVLTGDDNPGMRVQAIDLLTAAQDRSLVGILQDVARKEQNNYVRMRSRAALQEMNASVEAF